MLIKNLGLSIMVLSFWSCSTHSDSWEIASPNAQIQVNLKKEKDDENDQLAYVIYTKNNKEYHALSGSSPLGIERENAQFIHNLKFISQRTTINNKVDYQLKSGSKLVYENIYNESVFSFSNEKSNLVNIVFRVFNNGVAFRYEFPENGIKQIRIIHEHTGFNFGEGQFWAHPYDSITPWTPGYETFYTKALKIGTNAPSNKNGWAFPLLFNTQNHWLYVSESGFDGTYGASHIEPDCADGLYKIRFAEQAEAMGYYENTSYGDLPYKSPWRFITIGKELSSIVESHMVSDLALARNIEKTDWIKPGRSSWSWWSEPDSPQDFNKLTPFIDLAADMGWEYSLVDANWNHMKNGTLNDLVTYAKAKNVALLVWYNSGGKHNVVTEEPRDLMDIGTERKKEFKRISELGIKGVKIDFFQSDKQAIIKQYIDILEDAATYNLVVNFHGCTLPKGWRRTYPNLLSMEAIRGAETYIFDKKYPALAPAHIATIPFLRGVAGPTDYTPGGFANNKNAHLTTLGFELALPIIIESGITHYVTDKETMSTLPEFAIHLLKEIPATWDDLVFMDGFPGEFAVLARKKENRWFIAGINGTNEHKSIQLPLSKFGENILHIQLIGDDSASNKLEQKTLDVTKQNVEISMNAYGGFVIYIETK